MIPIVVVVFMVTLMVFLPMVVIVVASETVLMFAIICMGPFDLACPSGLLLATALGFGAAAVVRVIFP